MLPGSRNPAARETPVPGLADERAGHPAAQSASPPDQAGQNGQGIVGGGNPGFVARSEKLDERVGLGSVERG